ncbi:Ribonuclease/ribotoxin [Flagelloscypha sp. PMI_526]|nr:Ribonuclease/ribotoxin [Flagelloscypha sp. PMI_526]
MRFTSLSVFILAAVLAVAAPLDSQVLNTRSAPLTQQSNPLIPAGGSAPKTATKGTPLPTIPFTGMKCAGVRTWKTKELQDAINAGLQAEKSVGKTAGVRFPKAINNPQDLIVNAPDECKVKSDQDILEFPLIVGKVYTGGSPGTDRVLFSSKGAYCGVVTHEGAVGNNFVRCFENPPIDASDSLKLAPRPRPKAKPSTSKPVAPVAPAAPVVPAAPAAPAVPLPPAPVAPVSPRPATPASPKAAAPVSPKPATPPPRGKGR